MTLVLDLLENAGLLLAVCFTYRFIAARWPDDRLHRESGAGVLFGAAAAIAMSMAVAVPGVGIFDARTVVLSLGALYGGPVTAALAGGLAGGYRIYLGGETAAIVVGVLVITSACLIGLGLRRRWRDRLTEIAGWRFLAFGAAVEELQAGRGSRYDAGVVDACLAELEARGGAWWSADSPRDAA